MAYANLEIPKSVIDKIDKLEQNTRKMMEEMVKAGGKVTYNAMIGNLPQGIRDSGMMNNLRMTRVYDTPSDKGINCKVGFYGYFVNEDGKAVPAPLVANIYEYGRSHPSYPYHPFMRQSFNESAIMKAMLEIQKKYLPEGAE